MIPVHSIAPSTVDASNAATADAPTATPDVLPRITAGRALIEPGNFLCTKEDGVEEVQRRTAEYDAPIQGSAEERYIRDKFGCRVVAEFLPVLVICRPTSTTCEPDMRVAGHGIVSVRPLRDGANSYVTSSAIKQFVMNEPLYSEELEAEYAAQSRLSSLMTAADLLGVVRETTGWQTSPTKNGIIVDYGYYTSDGEKRAMNTRKPHGVSL